MAESQHPETASAASSDFRDPGRARQNLEAIAARVPPQVAAAIPALLTDAPDPDSALNLFERLTAAASPELFRTLDRQRALIHYALLVFGHSQYLGETLIKSPDIFAVLAREHALDRSHSREEFREAFARFRSRSFENDIATLLARFKRREYVRIVLRDILGIATLAEITSEVSALADVLIEEALHETQASFLNRYGTLQYRDAEGRLVDVPIAVLSLGKLGGNELNYSSDIDLLFIYGDGEDAGTAKVSIREYFIRLAQTVTDVLSRVTPEGSVFRVDLRLRPQGGQGEPAVSFSHALDYYENSAGDWELQAMIKARHSAGDLNLARQFIRGVQPFVYRAGAEQSLNFAAIETALESRDRITSHHRAAKRSAIDVKLDRGGIRDIEFLVQCLQRVYGGAEPWLRSGGTLFSLQKLHDKSHISGRDFHELNTAYEFLRRIEHRLQIRHGQQTHRIPPTDADVLVLARSVNPQATGHVPHQFVASVEQRMAAVTAIYNRIIYGTQLEEQQPAAPEFQLSESHEGREQSERQMLQRLAQDAPELHEIARNAPLGSHERRNLFRFLSAAFTGSDRYASIVRAPQGVARAMRLFALSDFATDLLLRHPDEIATLAALQPGGTPTASEPLFGSYDTAVAADPVFAYVSSSDVPYNEKLALLRKQFRHRVLASAARDVIESRPVFESLSETTRAADEAIAAAMAAANVPAGFAVLAMGRLGTLEFDLLSDADLVFVRDESLELSAATHTAENITQALSAYTREGTVFAVDTRLRPRGGEGELVITPAQLADYFRHEASPWEALSFTKLRFVAGTKPVGEAALDAVRALSSRYAADPGFVAAIRDMRRRLEQSGGAELNLKTSSGAMYDVDFIAKYLTVRAAAGVQTSNIRKRLEWLVSQKMLEADTGRELADAGELIRTAEHAVRLATGRSRSTLPLGENARRATEELVRAFLRRELPGGLEAVLGEAMARTRRLYDHLVR